MDETAGVLDYVKKFKAAIALVGTLGTTLVAFNGTITDYARMPGRVRQMDERVKVLENRWQDRNLMECVEAAEDEAVKMRCFEDWKASNEVP